MLVGWMDRLLVWEWAGLLFIMTAWNEISLFIVLFAWFLSALTIRDLISWIRQIIEACCGVRLISRHLELNVSATSVCWTTLLVLETGDVTLAGNYAESLPGVKDRQSFNCPGPFSQPHPAQPC